MASIKKECIMCSTGIDNENYELMNDHIKNTLNFLSITSVQFKEDRHVICNFCSTKLSDAFEFKSTCMYTHSVITTYAGLKIPLSNDLRDIYHMNKNNKDPGLEKLSQQDLRDIYLKEKDVEHAAMLSEDEKICTLCMELAGNEFLPLLETDMDLFCPFLPEIDLHLVLDSVMCNPCAHSLTTHCQFLKNCSKISEEINNSYYSEEVHKDDWFLESIIKTEEVVLKVDEFSVESVMGLEKIKTESQEDKPISVKTEAIVIKTEDDQFRDNFLTSEIHPDASLANQKVTVQTHKCINCDYKTHSKGYLKKHQLVHKDPSEVKMYKCDLCTFETKRKVGLSQHLLIHKDPSQVEMYKCDLCNFISKMKGNLLRHMLIHKDNSQVQIYKCDVCDYETKVKNTFERHQLRHKDSSQVQMYKCELCDYEAKRKDNLNRHQLKHVAPSQRQIYKCKTCDYEIDCKNSLKMHQLKHKDSSQVQMYKCGICNHEIRYKKNLKRHQLKHKDLNADV